MRRPPSHRRHITQQAGFTLIELLVVVAILSSMAYLAADALTEDDGQRRFDDTKQRLTTIKRAIIGDPDRHVNGSPRISGFVADIGRLPRCLQELTERDADCNNDGNPDTHIAAEAAFNPDAQVMNGWNGPYLSVLREIDGDLVYRDGWGNPVGGDVIKDFGWITKHAKKNGTDTTNSEIVELADRDSADEKEIALNRGLHISSFGRDSRENSVGAALAEYEVDYPRYAPTVAGMEQDKQLIVQADHHVDLEDRKISLTFETDDPSNTNILTEMGGDAICLQIAFPKDGNRLDGDDVHAFSVDLTPDDGNAFPTHIPSNSSVTDSFTITCPGTDCDVSAGETKEVLVPWGQRAIRVGKIYDHDGKDYCTDLNRVPADFTDPDDGTPLAADVQLTIARTAHSYPIQIIPRTALVLPAIKVRWSDAENKWYVEFN